MDIIDEESIKEKKSYEFSIAGIKLKLNSTFFALAIPILTTLGGASWGAFQVYNDYMSMKAKIEKYVAPDLTTFDKRLAVLEQSNQEQLDYTREIKMDLKDEIGTIDSTAMDTQQISKENQRITDSQVRDIQAEVRSIRKDVETAIRANERETNSELAKLRTDVDAKIKRAIDNPLANR